MARRFGGPFVARCPHFNRLALAVELVQQAIAPLDHYHIFKSLLATLHMFCLNPTGPALLGKYAAPQKITLVS